VYDGGELVLNKRLEGDGVDWVRESPLLTLKVGANLLSGALNRSRSRGLADRGIRAGKALFSHFRNRQTPGALMMEAEPNAVSFEVRSVNWPMSRISRWTRNHSNLESIIATRRRNYQVLLDRLTGGSARPLHPELPGGICPWIFPVFFPHQRDAHLALRDRGVPAVTWGGVRPEQLLHHQFEDADFLYENLVFLPIHQCLHEEEVVNMARAVREVCG
jgi:hypothetical protein